MSKEQLLAILGSIVRRRQTSGYSVLNAHIDADSALLWYINDKDISKAYDAIEKRYV